ncbi:MAG: ASCH domain-containing protein [Candidatus Nanopelagicales bacterium]
MTFPRVNGLRTVEFGNLGESRDKLIALILDGNKRATAGTLEWDYVAENEPIETVGEKLAVVDNENRHVATIKATRVEIKKFADVSDEFALAEAEGDLSGNDFRASHFEFWSKLGLNITGDTEIVLMYFDLLEDRRRSI